jgi:hypothetical protein
MAMKEPVRPSDSLPHALALRRMIFGHRMTQIIVAAARLGLADHLGETPRSYTELAPIVQANPRGLYRLLRALASLGLVEEAEDGRFTLTPVGACLRTDAPLGMRSWALFEGAEYYQRAWGNLQHAVKTGDYALGMHFYQYMGQFPDARQTFSQAMVDFARLSADAVVAAYDFSAARTIVDVGGGQGILLEAILRAYPAPRGVLFDLPSAVEAAAQHLARAGLARRCELAGGDFFENVPPGGDVYILSRILMDYDDARCLRILGNCRAAMADRGKVLIVQQVLPAEFTDDTRETLFEGAMSDLNMMVMVNGHERTEAEYRALLEAAGLHITRVVPTGSLMSVIEAVRGGSQ